MSKEKPKKKEVKELAFNRDEARAEIIKKAEKEEKEDERDDSK